MILTESSVELARIERTLMPYFFSKAALTGRTSWLMIWVVYQTTSPSFFAAATNAASAARAEPAGRLKTAAMMKRRGQCRRAMALAGSISAPGRIASPAGRAQAVRRAAGGRRWTGGGAGGRLGNRRVNGWVGMRPGGGGWARSPEAAGAQAGGGRGAAASRTGRWRWG